MVLSPFHRSLVRELETADMVRDIMREHPGARVTHKVAQHQSDVLSDLDALAQAVSDRAAPSPDTINTSTADLSPKFQASDSGFGFTAF